MRWASHSGQLRSLHFCSVSLVFGFSLLLSILLRHQQRTRPAKPTLLPLYHFDLLGNSIYTVVKWSATIEHSFCKIYFKLWTTLLRPFCSLYGKLRIRTLNLFCNEGMLLKNNKQNKTFLELWTTQYTKHLEHSILDQSDIQVNVISCNLSVTLSDYRF